MMKIQFFIQLSILILLTSCAAHDESRRESRYTTHKKSIYKSLKNKQKATSKHVFLFNQGDTLVPVDYFNPAIYWELKYATTDNFMQRKLYDTLDKPYIQISIARKLAQCQAYLSAKSPTYHLLVYDALRPLSVQWQMWNALDTIPVSERVNFVSNPANGSVHNYGAAVHITICSASKKPLNMGAGYDDIRKIAYPSLESDFLKTGELTDKHIANRQLLREVMQQQHFRNIPTEWWHFNADSRNVIRTKYKIIQNEGLSSN